MAKTVARLLFLSFTLAIAVPTLSHATVNPAQRTVPTHSSNSRKAYLKQQKKQQKKMRKAQKKAQAKSRKLHKADH